MSDKIFVENSEFTDLDVSNILHGSKLIGEPILVSLSSGRKYVVCESDDYYTITDLSKESRDLGFNLENIPLEDLSEEFILCEKAAVSMFRDVETPYRTKEEYNQILKDLDLFREKINYE